MGYDYYSILDIPRSSSDVDIKKAFRKLAIKYHPKKNKGNDKALETFELICESYDVLSDESKRATFDQFGEEGLKSGVPKGKYTAGAWTEGYIFHGNADKVFRDFFGGDNPFQEFYDKIDGDMSMGFGGLKGRGVRKQDPPIENQFLLSLDETFNGSLKKMKISRRVLNDDGQTTSIRDKILTINVKPGWKEGTRITFPEEGDQGPNNIPADIVFIIKDKPHPFFHREGVDLIYNATLPLSHALTGTVMEINMVDGRILHIPITDIVKPGYTKIVTGEGMPLNGDPMNRGDMIIRFEIEFPLHLTTDKKELLRVALPKDLRPVKIIKNEK